jgi:hypothetical protein
MNRNEEKMAKRKYDDMFLKPEITQAGDYQIFKMKGKDARGFDWMVRFAPITEKTYPYIDKISGEMEVTLGKDKEKYNINKATLVYIPKGEPVTHKIVKKPKEITWLLNMNLTPKYVAPKAKTAVKKGGKK